MKQKICLLAMGMVVSLGTVAGDYGHPYVAKFRSPVVNHYVVDHIVDRHEEKRCCAVPIHQKKFVLRENSLGKIEITDPNSSAAIGTIQIEIDGSSNNEVMVHQEIDGRKRNIKIKGTTK